MRLKTIGFLFLAMTMNACVPQAALEHDNAEIDRLMNQKQASVEACYNHLKASRVHNPFMIVSNKN